jgi:6-phosphofructokinase 2
MPEQKSGQPAGGIAVLTLNPSVDVTYEVRQLIREEKVHALQTRYDPGGNGINVGRTLKRLGVRAETFCLVAGEIGRFLERMLEQELDARHCLQIPGETRINCTLLQVEPRVQYEVTAQGPCVPPWALEALSTGFLHAARAGFGVLTGSLPPGVSDGTYAGLVRRLRDSGARAVVDAQAPALAAAITARPFLIKPNRYELEMLCGQALPTRAHVVATARDLQRAGVEWVCVSLGAEGAVLVGAEDAYYARTPRINLRSTVGAGDAMLAGLVAGFARGEPPDAVLRTGVACGSATAEQFGTLLCAPEDVERLGRTIDVERLGPVPVPRKILEPGGAATSRARASG